MVRCLVAGDDAPGERHRVEHLVARPRVARPGGCGPEERDVERRVVRDEDRAPDELEERRDDCLDPRCVRDHGGADPCEAGDERRHGDARVDECLELPDALAGPHLDRADLGDLAVLRRAAGRLEVDHHERHVVQRGAQLVQPELDGSPGDVWRRLEARLGGSDLTTPLPCTRERAERSYG